MDSLSLDELTDDHLLSLIRDGDRAAFGVLYERYRVVARRFALHLNAQSDADDVVAESFTTVLSTIEKGKGPTENFKTYLLTVVRHRVYTVYSQREKVHPTEQMGKLDGVVYQPDIVEPDQELAQAWTELLPRHRDILRATVLQDKKPDSIAPEMGINPNAVSAVAYRARTILKRKYLEFQEGST